MKSKAGMPAREGYTKSVTVYLTPEDLAYLEAMPSNSLAAAVRECIAWYRDTHGAAFLSRCARDNRDPAETLAQLLWGYVTMPTPAEVREALERGPQGDSADTAS
jgi:hypothetical protein